MKFFFIIQKSSSQFQYSAYLDDVQDIPEPSSPRYYQYSMHHTLQPKNDDPNTVSSIGEILFVGCVKYVPLTSSLKYLHLSRLDIQYEYGYGLCLQHPLGFEYSHYCISERSNPSCDFEYLLVKHGNGISLPILGAQTTDLNYGSFFDNQPYHKSMKFIETKSSCNEIAGF